MIVYVFGESTFVILENVLKRKICDKINIAQYKKLEHTRLFLTVGLLLKNLKISNNANSRL